MSNTLMSSDSRQEMHVLKKLTLNIEHAFELVENHEEAFPEIYNFLFEPFLKFQFRQDRKHIFELVFSETKIK